MSRTPFDPDCGLDITSTTMRGIEDIATIDTYGYRVVVRPDGQHFLHEAYYDHGGRLLGVALSPAHICGDSLDELREVIDLMRTGMEEPPLASDEVGIPGSANAS